MKLITVAANRDINVHPFSAFDWQVTMIHLAIGSFGHLLTSRSPGAYTFGEFADIISEHYDTVDNPHNRAVVTALKNVQALTEQYVAALTASV